MKQHFIQQNNTENLTLFFAGWGVNERLFTLLPPTDNDILMCYDYRDTRFDYQLLESYKQVRLAAWSLGVWLAAFTLNQTEIRFSEKIAFNGTMRPIDDEKGIPMAVYEATYEYLTDVSLQKFNRRMCGSQDFYREFMRKNPQRNVEALKEELNSIKTIYKQTPAIDFEWTKAIVGANDRIFLPENQLVSWENKIVIIKKEVFHYDKNTLEELISGY